MARLYASAAQFEGGAACSEGEARAANFNRSSGRAAGLTLIVFPTDVVIRAVSVRKLRSLTSLTNSHTKSRGQFRLDAK